MSEEEGKDDKSNPKSWWQWFLIYPTLLVALLTAGPQWFDSINGLIDDMTDEQSDTELVRFMKRNDRCVRTPISNTVISPGKSEIWAVICSETGDIFVQITTPGGETFYSGVFVDELNQRKERGEGMFVTSIEGGRDVEVASADTGAGWLFAAYAASVDPDSPPVPRRTPRPGFGGQTLAQATVVVCQTFRNDGRIVRRLRQGNQCYDEVVNGQTGRVERKDPVPCDKPCS